MALVQSLTDGFGRAYLTVEESGLIEFPISGVALTPCGGFARRFINKTGAPTVRGTVVTTGGAANGVVAVTAGVPNAIGTVWCVGKADGEWCYVTVSGVADVLLADGQEAVYGYWCGSSESVAGRAEIRATLPDAGTPGIVIHNREMGHVVSSIAAGTDVVCRVLLHFN